MTNTNKGAQVLRGFCMGCADVIPGVSGGTMALILGIYEQLIDSIRLMDMRLVALLFRKDFWVALFRGLVTDATTGDEELDRRVRAAHFLAFLVLGILIAVGAAAKLIGWARDTHPTPTRAFFFGLVLISVQVPFRHMKRRSAGALIAAAIAAVATYLVLGLGQAPDNPSLWYLFLCGAIAISAMILPGISGAFFLLMLGVYGPVLKSVELLVYEQQLSAALPLIVLVAGIVVGIGAFSRVLHWLLAHHHDVTMGALVGLMIGSLRVLWPFKVAAADVHRTEFLDNRLPLTDGGLDPALWPALGTFVAGVLVVLLLDWIGRRRDADQGA
jgi:putative membrane protein